MTKERIFVREARDGRSCRDILKAERLRFARMDEWVGLGYDPGAFRLYGEYKAERRRIERDNGDETPEETYRRLYFREGMCEQLPAGWM